MGACLSSFFKLSGLLVTGLICISAVVSLPSPAGAEEISARFMADYGNVTVMEVTGNFDENTSDGAPNVAPRQAVAREFFRTHKDDYDFVTIFTNFDFKLNPNAVAFYSSVKNDVGGIGKEIFDYSSQYGSNARLQGTIDMGNRHNLVTDPLNAEFEFTVDTLIHEMQHRWGAYLKFKDWNGSESTALLGYQASHWSYLFDSGGSTHLGNRWQNNGDGTFTSTAVRKYYSPLDLYLMGMIDKSKVPPTLLIENPAIDPSSMPKLGSTISGTARYVNIDDIIAVEGERTPTAGDSQKQFRMAFIYAVAPGTFNADDLPGIENVRNGYLTRYSILTDGKGLVQVTSTPREELPANPGIRPPVTVPRTLPPNVNDGLNWLLSHQQADGSWTDFALTTERDTAESVATLQIFPTAQEQFLAGLNWLGANASNTTDYLARRIESRVHAGGDSSSLVQELLSRSNSDGGWGGGRNFVSSPTDTALALKALAAAGYSDRSVVGKAVAYLQSTQNPDGGWSGDKSASIIQPTAAVLSAYNSYRKSFALETGISKAVAFLAAKQNPDGGFGNSPSTVYDSSLALMALQAVNGDRISIGSGLSYLLNQQTQDGSWNESPFQTALAMRAVWQATVDPDLSVKAEDVSIIPATITALPTNAVLSATIRNLGRSDVSQAKVSLYEGSIAPDHKLAEQTLAFPGQSPVTVTFAIPVTSASGHVYHVVADPDRQLAESNENNNSAVKSLLPEITYDFQLQASDITIAPNPADIGKDVKISLKLANRGTSDAYSVPVRIFIDQPGAPLEIAQLSVDIPSGAAITREVTWRAGLAGANLPLTVQIDPNGTFTETNKDNNSAAVPLTVNASTLPNLSVSYRDMLITPSPAREGGSASISVLVKNDGYSDVENVRVTFYNGTASNGGAILGSQLIPAIPAGQSVRTSIDWTGIAVNGGQLITVQVDPDNAIQEIAEDDNFTFSTIKILGLPDVSVSSDSLTITPSAPKEGDQVVIALTVRNLGDQDATNVEVLFKVGDIAIGSQIIPLLAGNSQVILNMPYSPLGSGVRQLTAIADPESRIVERDKQNNVTTRAFTVQNARFWLSERYISPNGDGNRDNTQLFFRPDAPTSITIEISDALGIVVRNFGGGDLDNTSGTTVTWDGKDNNGSVVRDGTYGIVIYGGSLRVLARESIVVDTNRLPLSGALSANSLIERNIACHLPLERSRNTIAWLPDESGLLVHLLKTVPQTPEYPAGIYILSPNGDVATQVLPERWSDSSYDYALETDSVTLAPDAKSLAFIAWRKDRTTGRESSGIWSSDLSGANRRLLYLETEYLDVWDMKWSPDSKKILYNYGPVYREGWYHYELAYVGVEQGDKNTIAYGYPLGYSGLIGTAWSPDSTRIAFIQNLFCNAEGKSCNQENERLMVYGLNGSTSTWKVNNSSRYSYDSINWVDNSSLFYDYDSNGNIELIRDGVATPIVTDAQEYVISPQGDKVAFVDNEINNGNWISSNLKTVDSEGLVTVLHKVVKSPQHGYEIYPQILNLIWSPDGKKITFVEGLDGVLCEYYGKLCPEAYGPNLMTVNLASGSKESSPLAWPWSYTGFHLNLLDWLDNGSVLLAQDSTYGSNNPLLAIGVQNASSTPLVQGVSLPGEEELLLSPGKNYLTYDSYGMTRPVDGVCRSSLWSSTSGANLTAELQAIKGKQSVLLKGVATDLNFESYAIEYATADAPSEWNIVVPLSTTPVINGTFTDWLPPAIGSYLVRLSVRDLAGNVASKTIHVAWGTSLPLHSLIKSAEIISPNGDGVQDAVTFEYSVSEPVHLDFVISNQSGAVVRSISVEHPLPLRGSITWDGRDELGAVVPDGIYRIAVFDYSFSVEVDSSVPQSSIRIGTIKVDGNGAGYYRVELTGRAFDKNLTSWMLDYGVGDNPQEWLPVWFSKSRGDENLIKRDESGNPVVPETDALIYSFFDADISSLKGKKFRVTVVDRAGNSSTAISDFVEEKALILSWDGKPTPGIIPPELAAVGKHDISGFETLRLPVTSQRVQYWHNDIWLDTGNEPPGAQGSVAYTWNSSGLQLGNTYKVRMVVVDQGGRSFVTNEFNTHAVLSLEAVCPSGKLLTEIALLEEIRSLVLTVHSDQDERYREWNTYHRLDLPPGQPVFTGSLPAPEVSAGMRYQIKMTVIGESGKVYERQAPYPPSCPVNIDLVAAYEDATGCGQTSNGRVTLSTRQKEPYPQARFLKLDYFLLHSTGKRLLQSVDMSSDGWKQAILDTSVMVEGDYQVQAVVAYYDIVDGKSKESTATSRVLVDRVLPTARLTYPTGSGTTLCPVKVPVSGGSRHGIPLEGIADDAGGIKRYELLFSSGSSPANWQQTYSVQASSVDPSGFRSVPIEGRGAKNGQFGIWDVNDLSGAYYTIRLRVVDTVGNSSCTTADVSFDKVVQVLSLATDKTVLSASGKPGSAMTASYRIDENSNVQSSVYRLIERLNLPPLLDVSPIRTIGGATPYLSGIGTSSWDGLTDTGGAAPDGRYAFVVNATDTCGNTGTKWAPVDVDSLPPLAAISYPATSSPLLPAMLVDVKGSVSDAHLSSYTLEAGEGATPSAWHTVSTGNREVRDASLGSWNTYGLAGHWTLRLSAADTAGNTVLQTVGVDLSQRSTPIKSLNLTPMLFSPNGDQRLDTTSISYEVNDSVFLKIEIVDASNTVIREFVRVAASGAGSITWDGRNSSGAVAADGPYTVKLTASLSANPSVTQTETVSMVIDGKPPVIDITKPAEAACLNTSALAVSGSVTDQNIDNYSVTLTGPSGTIAQEQGRQNRQNHTFSAIENLDENTYTLIVESVDLGENRTRLVRTFTIDRTPPKVTLNSPKAGEFYGNSKNLIAISGVIDEKNLERYSLRYGPGDAPTEWTEIVAGSSLPSGSIPSSLKVGKADGIADGLYTISLYARDKAGLEAEAMARIVVDNTAPDVSLTYPKEGDYITGAMDIKGIVVDSYFDKGSLELAEGSCATAAKWAVFKSISTKVSDGVLDSWKLLPADGEYCLRISATDKSGNRSEARVGFRIDTHPPATPRLSGRTEDKTANSLNWTKSPETDVAGYNVYRSGQKLNSALLTDLAYTDSGLKEGAYAYLVKAVDIAGNESDASNVVNLKVDLNGPTVRISSPAGGARISGLADIKGTAHSQDDFKEYRVSIGQGSSPSAWTVIRRSPLPISFGTLAQWDSLGSQDGAQFSIKLEGEDISGNISSAQTTVTIDNTAPQTPLLLSAIPNNADVSLSWKANTDPDLAGYLLYRNDQLANVTGIVAGSMKPYLVTGTNYTDKALPDGTYRYYLVAMDQAENSSDQSNILEVSIDTHPPHMTISEPANGLRFATKAMIRAESADNDIATVQFKYKRPQDTDWSNLGAPLAKAPFMVYFDPKSMSLAYGDYQLQALAFDRGGKPDPAPPVVTLTYTDLTPPESPVSPTAKVNGPDVTLTWGAGIEADLDGYNVYRWNNGSKTRLNVAIVKNPVYADAGVPDGNYGYEITAIDIHGNESKPAAQVAARIYAPLVTQPYTPLRTADLTLEGSGVTPNSSVEMTMVTSSGATTKTTISADSSGRFRQEGISLALGDTSFSATAIDGEGNISRSSEPVVVSFDEPPAAPTGLAASVDGYDVSLTWNGNSEPDIIGYNLFRDGEKLNNSLAVTGGSASASSYQDYYTDPQKAMDGNYSTYWSTGYGYGTFTPAWWQMALQSPELINKVDIRWRGEWDSANNRYNILAGKDYEVQGWSGHNWVTLKQVVGNDQQYNTFDVSPSYRTDKIRIAITSSTDRNPSKYARIDEIRFQKDGLLVSPGYSDQGLLDKRYSYQVTAIDRYGFESAPSSPAVAAVGDVEPPGAPLALSATVQGSDVVLSWSPPLPAADDLSEYYVYRETPSGWILVGVVSPLVPSYNDRNLANNSYRYRVTARDFKGNESAFSNEASATVQVELPASPPLLSVSAPASGSILDLSWQPPAGSGQYSYNVYRSLNESGTFIRVNTSTVTGTKFHDNGLANGISYYYRVKALDSIGNEGEASNTASGVPRDTVTVQPMILKPTVPGTAFVTREYGLTIGGFAEPAALVDVLGDDELIGSATASTVERQTDVAMAMDTYAVSLSPDGKLLASNINSQDLTLLDMSNNITTNVSSGLSYIWGDLQWSPSGRYLLITGYDHDLQPRITLYDRESGSMRIAATGDTLNEFSPSWSSRSDNYVFAGANPNGQTSMWIASPGDGSVIRIADVNFADLPRLSPDGTRVAYFDNGVLFVFDRTNSTTTLIDDNNDQWSSSWSPDGSGIAFVSYRDGDGDIYSYDFAAGSVERRTTSKQGGYRVVWSPDGLQLGYVAYSGSDELFMVVDANGGEKRVFNASGEIYGIPEWRTNGELIIFDQLGLHTVQPPGYFSAQIDRLIPGENHLVAVSTDTYGNRSTPSDSITVVLDTGIMPDLAIAESDISFFPPIPKPGEEVLLTARVRNTSNNPAGNVAIDLYLWDGSGDVALIKSESIPGIVANGDGAVSARFIVGTDIGTSTVIAVVDPANWIQEMVETNNHAAKDLIVTDQELVSISSSTSSSQFGANQEASFEVTLMNRGLPTSGTLKVMVEDSNGNLVQLITSQPQDLPYALNQKLAFTWNTGATYAGFYRLHVLVTDEIGTVTLAESATPFSILPDIKASGSITTDKQSYGPGETVVVNVSFNNSGVNHVIPQLKARLQIVDSGNTQLFNEEKSFASLLPAMGGSFSAVWNTGSLPAGTYAAVMDLSAEDQLLDTKTTVFNILPQPLLKGALTTDTATVLTGRSFTAGYTLSNHGNSTATGIVRITLQDPDGQTIVASSEQPGAIQVNGSVPGSVTFDTTGLAPKTYQVVLTFKSDATWQNIAMATIAVKDGLPPTISIVSPLEAASYSTDVSLSVFASDDFSGVDKVEYSIDSGAWKPLPLADASKGRYTSSWTPALADNGSHSVSFRGVDRAGNSSIPVSVNFHVQIDTTAPVLIVSTLANESYTNNEVLNISGTVTDNVAVKELLINGATVPFNPDGTFSHALILADGSNTVEVTATDMASNPVSDTRTIHLDQKAPLIDVTSPADNSKTGKPEIFVRGNVDETSSVEVLLNGVTQPSERQGDAFEANLTPVYGSNTIEVVAVDLAANKGTEKRTVTFDDQKPSLAITEPGQDIRTNRDVLILKGTVADTLNSVSVSIEMDGATYTPVVTDGGFEQRLVMTEEKSHVIKVTATDEVGNSISVLRNVIYDITPPALTIDPVESPTIDGSQIINGTREPDSAVVVTSSTAAVGDVTYPTDTTWQVSLTLMPGSNIVTASSTDGANNVATISKEIVYTVSTSNNIFSAAIFGNSGVTMTGNSYTDSYINSPSSWIRGKYKNGDVASNSLQPCGIKMSGGTQVFGKLWVGQDGNPAIVGCTNGGATVSGGSGALAVAKDMTPKADPAGGISIGAIKLSGHGSKTLAAGDYRVSTININGNSTLYLSGPLTLHVDGNFSLSGNSSIVITSGEVTIYQNGRKLQISCGSIVNTNKTPASLVIYGTAGLQTVDISGNTDLHALVYAPTAVIRLSGGQNTFGSIIGSSVDISGGSSVHYDEGLKE